MRNKSKKAETKQTHKSQTLKMGLGVSGEMGRRERERWAFFAAPFFFLFLILFFVLQHINIIYKQQHKREPTATPPKSIIYKYLSIII